MSQNITELEQKVLKAAGMKTSTPRAFLYSK